MNSLLVRRLKFYGWFLSGLVVVGWVMRPVHRDRESAIRASCQSNLRQIGLALQQYSLDYDGRLPSADWGKVLMPYAKNERLFYCPSANTVEGASDYFFNARFLGKATGKISSPNTLVLMGDGVNGLLSATLPAFPSAWRTDEYSPAWRHLGAGNYLFADGHVKALKVNRVNRDFRMVVR